MQKFLILLILTLTMSAPQSDVIDFLPDYPYEGLQYSGYLPVDSNKQFHYIFSESQNNPETDPIVLWFTGKAGCSSLTGWAQENGPAVFKQESNQFILNPYPFNANASILYLESPAGVGFSYSTNKVSNNDQSTAIDNLKAIISFFEKFPEYKNNQLLLAGELYAGIFVPTLAKEILDYNKISKQRINLKGILIGNGFTDPESENYSTYYDYLYDYALYSPNIRDDLTGFCLGENNVKKGEKMCRYTLSYIDWITDWINPFNLYGECFDFVEPGEAPVKPTTKEHFVSKNFNVDFPFSQSKLVASKKNLIPRCLDTVGPNYYFNRADVQAALHVKKTNWTICNDVNYTPDLKGSFYLYPELISAGLNIVVYSGDLDTVVNISGTRKWIKKLGLEIEQPWTYWTMDGADVSGYVTHYKGLSFVTVKGVGHHVPQYAPDRGQHIFNSWIFQAPF